MLPSHPLLLHDRQELADKVTVAFRSDNHQIIDTLAYFLGNLVNRLALSEPDESSGPA